MLIMPPTLTLATAPFPRVRPGAWEGHQTGALAQGEAGVPDTAQWALASKQEQWEPWVVSRLAITGQPPSQPCARVPVAAGRRSPLLSVADQYQLQPGEAPL